MTSQVLRVTVKDHGKGISQESFPRIFEPFSQESVDTGSIYGGTGLGLRYVCNFCNVARYALS